MISVPSRRVAGKEGGKSKVQFPNREVENPGVENPNVQIPNPNEGPMTKIQFSMEEQMRGRISSLDIGH